MALDRDADATILGLSPFGYIQVRQHLNSGGNHGRSIAGQFNFFPNHAW